MRGQGVSMRFIKLNHLNSRLFFLFFIYIFLVIPILIFFYYLSLNLENVPIFFSRNINKLLNIFLKIQNPVTPLIIIGIFSAVVKSLISVLLILGLVFVYQTFGKYLNVCLVVSLRQFDRVIGAISRDIALIIFIVMILCLYQISHLILRYNASPPETIPYSAILKSDLLKHKRFESNIYDGIIWYYTRAPASIASSHPIISYREGDKVYSQAISMPEYYLCDDSRISFINSGGFINKEPYSGFAIEFDRKNCTYVANFLEKRGYKTIIKTPRYSINKFPHE
jgi:hypothetical protein